MNPAMPSVMTGAGNLFDQRKQLHESIYAAMVGCAVKMIAPEGSRCRQDDSKNNFQH